MLCLQQIALFPKGERRRQSLDGRKDLSILNVMFDSTILGVFWCSSEYLGNPSKTWANFSKPSPTQYFAGNAKSKTFQDGETKMYFHGIIFLILNISFLFPESKNQLYFRKRTSHTIHPTVNQIIFCVLGSTSAMYAPFVNCKFVE